MKCPGCGEEDVQVVVVADTYATLQWGQNDEGNDYFQVVETNDVMFESDVSATCMSCDYVTELWCFVDEYDMTPATLPDGSSVWVRCIPQAWVNDYAVDAESEIVWRMATDTLNNLAARAGLTVEDIAEMLDGGDTVGGDYIYDELQDSPEAPAEVKKWQGPFNITVYSEN